MKTIYDVADELNARIEITRYPKQGMRFTASLRIYTDIGSTGFNLIGEKFDTLGETKHVFVRRRGVCF